MSFKTFNISTENEFETASGSLPHSSLQLTLSSGNHYNSLSPHTGASSPDFSRSTTNLSDRDTSSPPDINMLECREDSPVGHFNTQTVITDTSIFTTSPNNNTLSGVTMNLNQTFITTPVNCSVNFWNENMTVAMNASELGLEEGQSFSDDTRAKGYNTVTFQDSTERDSQLNSCETSRRGSSENDCCFLSSGEMVMRSNSFCLEDQTLPIISSLEESSFSSPMSSAALPAEVSLVTATLPDVCEGIQEQRSPGGITTENAGPPCLGITFIQADDYELPTESNDMATSSSDVALPSEDEGALLRTFVYETTPSDFGAVALHSADSNPDASLLSCFPQTFTHEQGKTFIARDMKDAGKDVQTSTPVQSSGNRMLSLPSLSESPLAESAGTSAAHPPKQQQRSLTPKQRLVVRLPPSAKRLSKIEIKKFPKPDFSSVKSKIMTRPAQQQGLSGPASQHKSSQVNVHSKQAQLHRRAPVDIAHAKTESSKSRVGGAAGATNDESKRFQGWPSPRRVTGASACQPPPASSSLRPAPLSAKQRQGNLGNDECSTSKVTGSPQPKQKSTAGTSQRAQAPEEPSLRAPSATGNTRPLVNGSRPTPTPIRPSSMGPPSTPASRVPRQPQGRSRNLFVEASVHSEQSGGTGSSKVSGAATHRSTPLKTAVLKARLISSAGRNTGPTLVTACKSATPTTQGSSKSTASSLKRTSSRAVRLSSSVPVDKNKPKACFHQQQPQQQAAQPAQGNGPPDLVPADVTEDYRAQCERKDQSLQQLRGLLAASNCRFEATAVVLQQTLAERDEAMRQRRELSQELVTLKGELVCSLQSCERLEKEKEDLNVTLEETLQKLQEQHLKELEQLEQKLQAFYQAEWDKVHLTYQEEADKCKALLEQQMGELKANHEAMKLELKASHAEQLKCVKQQYEESLEELRKVHDQEQQSLDNMMKEAEAALSGQIQELMEENNALTEKLKAEDNRRKELAEKNLKDSHTLYLEQELESLKVVLDIKNKQLHQQEKKLMQMDKLTEKSVKLDESLKKVQQENEDLKARMDRHAALSRQLSTEQAVLQESLQKESKVNKRLSMENEELLWKLHNGDLSSPRKTSPTSPSHSLSLQSPRSSVFLSSPPVSPR
ncbi:microtubule-associated tumor suppressor 1 homolog A isoform X3 [Myripristis murdjan]|uniref:microtubule-associated tumor suppressor 1 homolog A isoform X3 n=1 Tax=Myripristis murdjan TaxID=586833 RepID=UPI001175FEB1|nr:microtubule-associated tumor suppressor 1-like isoform X3 [Myripristis murdjan]